MELYFKIFFISIYFQTDQSLPAVDKMLAEMREVFETREIRDLLSTCTKTGLTCVLDKLAESVAALTEPQPESSFVHPNRVSVHLAKLVPVLNNFIFQDVWGVKLLTVEPLRVFGANIYESFST